MLDVTAKGLVCGGTTLHPAPKTPGNLAKTLHAGKIVSITFSPGAEGSEVVRLLKEVQRARTLSPDDDDDLRTLLWGLDLQYIQYAAEDARVAQKPVLEPAPPPPPKEKTTEESSELKARIREEAATPDRRTQVVDMRDFDSTLYFLEHREIEYLQEGIDLEYTQDLGHNLVSLLLDILESRPEAEARAEVIDVLGHLLPHLLADGAFASASYLLAEARELMQSSKISPPERKGLDSLAAKLSRPGALAQLLQFLEDAESPPSADQLGKLLSHLRPKALSTILKWLRGVTNPASAAALSDAVERMAKEQPQALVEALKSDDRAVLARAIELVDVLRSKESVEPLCDVGSHPDATLRVAAAEVMGNLGGSRCYAQLTRMVDDPDSAVRLTALKCLSARPYAPALRRLEALLNDEGLVERDLAEQRAIFETYGTIAGGGGFQLLEPLVRGKKGVGRHDPDIRACAALALGKLGTPEARMALQAAERDKNPVVRSAAARALREME